MADGSTPSARDARERAWATPLEDFQVADVELFASDTHGPWFERLRAEDPVHWCPQSEFGPYWSVTKFNDIIAVDGNHQVFSSASELGGITIMDAPEDRTRSSFIGLDPPIHDAQRRVVAPMFSSASMGALGPLIRERAAKILDQLPVGETFDFVDRVSVELTSQMLATLFDFPFEDRRLLPRASDLILATPGPGALVETEEQRQAEMFATLTRFVELWNARKGGEGRSDLVSMLANADATASEDPYQYIGNIVLLIVAGSDTTRHSITGALLALNANPSQYDKLRRDPALLESAVPEFIRWQSPVAHMRRTALADAEIGGKRIREGDKVVMWYVSGNRDETAIDRAGAFLVDRERPRQHVAFGFGVHRCVGARLAEMQLRIVWEEIFKRFPIIEVVGEPRRMRSNFVKGYESLPVRIPR
ncbi:MAG TPA: cytochrome P450 [Caulobacteraceae bacterium]|nr:cytochrome P450 [Caulobacteraceae bacterium]